MSKKHWQSFGQLTNSDSFKESSEKEFKEDLPMERFDSKGLLDLKSPRRDFLKYLGFSTAAAALAASCEIPVKKVIPYLNKPENLIPGVADYYATTYVSGGDVVPILAKVRDGRPIKIEGNELSSLTKGGTSAKVQASVLDLYDTARLRFPVQMVDGAPKQVPTFDDFDKLVAGGLASLSGAPIVLLTSTINSPTTKQIIAEFLAKNSGSRHVQYDVDSFSGILLANEASYGKRAIPSYQFDAAKIIVSLGADFLGTWLSPVEFARQYIKGRKIDEKNPAMSMHYQFESMLSTTGGNADDRYTHRPSETGAIALALLAELGGNTTAPALNDKLKAGIKKAAKDLAANKGKALVVSGSNDVNVQVIVNAINELIGANGTTVNWSTPVQTRQGVDSDFETLVSDLNAGKVGALFVYGVNPAYTYCAADKFKAGLQKTKVSVSFNDRIDETTELCKYAIPAPHFLESWGDAEAKTGYYSLLQPTIAPLFLTRAFEDSLLKWSGNSTTYENYFKQYWTNKLDGVDGYEKALQEGVIEPSPPSTTSATYNGGKVAEAFSAITSKKIGSGIELVLYQKISIGIGNHSNNPWLHELPDPITKATWDNYVIVSPDYAKKTWGLDLANRRQADKYEVYPEKRVVNIKAGGKELK
ncbi:MAG TPA: TAT-variant-translocated molybdopterin oxidoreductase, partial [Puia sp.]|nr:TAT-variant-translocated molybdopterin oxidoreductase [Puia sp.]